MLHVNPHHGCSRFPGLACNIRVGQLRAGVAYHSSRLRHPYASFVCVASFVKHLQIINSQLTFAITNHRSCRISFCLEHLSDLCRFARTCFSNDYSDPVPGHSIDNSLLVRPYRQFFMQFPGGHLGMRSPGGMQKCSRFRYERYI